MTWSGKFERGILTESRTASAWRVIGESVRGASHVSSDLPNQDAIGWWQPDTLAGLPLVLAVADGHGSPKSFRSKQGAAFAVEVAIHVMQRFIDTLPPDPALTKRLAEDRLPREIVRHWRDKVIQDIAQNPFADEERRESESRPATASRLLAYGATLLSVLVAETFIIYLQIGDGDILVVPEDGDTVRPLPRDDRLLGNETTSLCMPEAWNEMQIGFQTIWGRFPALILLCTDGYGNSFVDEANFLIIGRDLWEIMHNEGLPVVQENLMRWLAQTSENGSGDDITLGIACHTAGFPQADNL